MDRNNQQARIPSALNILFSLWLIASPWLLGYFTKSLVALWDAIIVGVIVLVLSWIRENNPATAPWMSWVNAVLGIWMIISPFILGVAAVPGVMVDFIIVGIAFLVFGIWSALATQRVHPAMP